MPIDTSTPPASDRLLELVATLVVAIGGTIGGALLALKKALKSAPPTEGGNGNGNGKVREDITELEKGLADVKTKVEIMWDDWLDNRGQDRDGRDRWRRPE